MEMDCCEYELKNCLPPDDIPCWSNDHLERLVAEDDDEFKCFLDEYILPWQECMNPVVAVVPEAAQVVARDETPSRSLSPEYPLPTSPEYPRAKVYKGPVASASRPPKMLKAPQEKKIYKKVNLNSDIRKQDLADFRNRTVDLLSCHSMLGHPDLFVDRKKESKMDFRTVFDRMPAKYQYEIMQLMPKKYVEITAEGRFILKPGILTSKDKNFQRLLLAFQSRLRSGEYNTEVRGIFIEMIADRIDPWKVANFEPVYGDLCTNHRVSDTTVSGSLLPRDSTPDTVSLAPSSPAVVNSPSGRSEKENLASPFVPVPDVVHAALAQFDHPGPAPDGFACKTGLSPLPH